MEVKVREPRETLDQGEVRMLLDRPFGEGVLEVGEKIVGDVLRDTLPEVVRLVV